MTRGKNVHIMDLFDHIKFTIMCWNEPLKLVEVTSTLLPMRLEKKLAKAHED